MARNKIGSEFGLMWLKGKKLKRKGCKCHWTYAMGYVDSVIHFVFVAKWLATSGKFDV